MTPTILFENQHGKITTTERGLSVYRADSKAIDPATMLPSGFKLLGSIYTEELEGFSVADFWFEFGSYLFPAGFDKTAQKEESAKLLGTLKQQVKQ